jgi:hypothetical protein
MAHLNQLFNAVLMAYSQFSHTCWLWARFAMKFLVQNDRIFSTFVGHVHTVI